MIDIVSEKNSVLCNVNGDIVQCSNCQTNYCFLEHHSKSEGDYDRISGKFTAPLYGVYMYQLTAGLVK